MTEVVANDFELDPYTKTLFLFCGTRKDRFKGLLWDGDGFLLYKRFEDGSLQWPTNQTEIRKLQPKQLERLLSGWSLDATIHKYQPRRRIK